MIGILGENESDSQSIKAIVRTLGGDAKLRFRTKGFNGGGNLLKKGAGHIKLDQDFGATHFIVCHDADGPDATDRRAEVLSKVICPAEVDETACILIPVYELEAWFLAAPDAVRHIFPQVKFKSPADPEAIADPKEKLILLSRGRNRRPRYDPHTHNEHISAHLDPHAVSLKCKSIRPLISFVATYVAENCS